MCPQPPPFSVPLDIDAGSTDEEVILFLGRRKAGDPTPSNVITEINPFSIDPRNSPEGIWFLYTSKNSESYNEGGIIKVTNGYWRSTDDYRILTGTPTVGRKTTREFFVGQAPLGDRTGWRMQEYCAENMASQVNNNKSQDNGTLCRFFLQNDGSSDFGEKCDPVSADDADGEFLESVLLGLQEQEERNLSSRDAANASQVVAGADEQRPPVGIPNDNSVEDVQAGYDFSKDDFIELKDLFDPVSSSSSSDNSSVVSMNSDECFDAESLLRDKENDGDQNVEERLDYRFNVTAPARSNQVVIPPASPAFLDDSNLALRDNGPANSIQSPNPALPSSAVEPQSDSDASTSSSSRGSQVNANRSGSSQKRSGSKSIRKMAKLGKRYCCFQSF